MKGLFKLRNIVGIGIFINWTFLLFTSYIIFSNYSTGYITEQIEWSVLFILSIFFTVFPNELEHVLAAKQNNIKVGLCGQVAKNS